MLNENCVAILSGVWISAIFGGLSPCLSPINNLRLSHWKKNLFCVCLICFFCGRCFLVSSFFPVKRLFDWCVFLLVESVKTWNLHVFVHVSWNEIKVSKPSCMKTSFSSFARQSYYLSIIVCTITIITNWN